MRRLHEPPPAGCEVLRQVIRSLLEEITGPSVPFMPSEDAKRQCPDCDFRYICGTSGLCRGGDEAIEFLTEVCSSE